MILFTLVGLGAQFLLGFDVGLALGILVGLVVANLVPSDKACPIGGRKGTGHGSTDRR
ncbi:MAG: hypothetical protein L6Q95_12285 [Planctomycetes bacterium]|nr:hypothetical protein [Planctomycetota bacterium]